MRLTTNEARARLLELLADPHAYSGSVIADLCEQYELRNPYKISGPAKISFSGGRTSGFMLKHCVDAGLADDVHVLFANTGKEREETLVFVDRCATAWGVDVHWVEYDPDAEIGYREVTFATASRAGEPFQRLIEERNYLPNPVTRFCTTDLKIRVMKAWMMHHGYEHWTNVVGLRADEPRRVARIRNRNDSGGRWDVELPLASASVNVAHVKAFWQAQTFDLDLESWEGNCDLCFLKGKAKRTRIMRDNPTAAAWWIANETTIRVPRKPLRVAKKIAFDVDDDDAQSFFPFDPKYMERSTPEKISATRSHPFRIDAPRYEALFQLSQQPMLDFGDADLESPDDIGDCFCNAA